HGGVILSSVPTTTVVGTVICEAVSRRSRVLMTLPQRPRGTDAHSWTMRRPRRTIRGSASLPMVMYFSAAVVARLRGPRGKVVTRNVFAAKLLSGPGRGRILARDG